MKIKNHAGSIIAFLASALAIGSLFLTFGSQNTVSKTGMEMISLFIQGSAGPEKWLSYLFYVLLAFPVIMIITAIRPRIGSCVLSVVLATMDFMLLLLLFVNMYVTYSGSGTRTVPGLGLYLDAAAHVLAVIGFGVCLGNICHRTAEKSRTAQPQQNVNVQQQNMQPVQNVQPQQNVQQVQNVQPQQNIPNVQNAGERRCPQCGAVCHPDDRFCNNCGHPLA